MSKILLRLAWLGLFSLSVAVAVLSDAPKHSLEAQHVIDGEVSWHLLYTSKCGAE